MSQLERARLALLTAKRAGLRRSLARGRRLVLLRVVYPRLGEWLYPLRPVVMGDAPRDTGIPLPIRADNVAWTGQIRLLNTQPFPMSPPVAWSLPANVGCAEWRHALWQFRLHEWEWAYPLLRGAAADAKTAQALAALLRDYFENVALGHRTAYEPYPLSRRLVAWTTALRVLRSRGGNESIAQELAQQMDRGARVLQANLERDLDNNHLIANACALAYAGTILQQPYASTGFALMWEQLRAQVRADGTHAENSPAYHFQVWRDAVEACMLARAMGESVPADMPPRLTAMYAFLNALRYPDGTFPALNDSVQDELSSVEQVRAAAKRAGLLTSLTERDCSSSIFADAGYAVLHDGEMRVTFDAGALGPAYCPGHGHADTLSFELWARGGARIVDAGVYQYEAGALRERLRGTGAHNTLQVDGLDSSEVAGSFRVGRMARATLQAERKGQHIKLVGAHDGYARLASPLWHRRQVSLKAGTLEITDEITGRGEHSYTLSFQLAPGARALADGKVANVQYADTVGLELEMQGAGGEIKIREGCVSPSWYTLLAAPALEYAWRGVPPFTVHTRIQLR